MSDGTITTEWTASGVVCGGTAQSTTAGICDPLTDNKNAIITSTASYDYSFDVYLYADTVAFDAYKVWVADTTNNTPSTTQIN
jgi:hypothetical protein